MTTTPTARRWRGAMALLAATTIGVIGIAMPASAADPVSLINKDAKGSITLTKYSTPNDERPTTEGDGKPWTPPAGSNSTLLEGATFELYKVNDANLADKIDLTTNLGWQNLEKLITKVGKNPTAAEIALKEPNLGLALESEQTTGASGVVKWETLSLGLYYVVETKVPSGHKASQPFFVTIPMTDPVNLNDWMYDIHVYPKNIKDDTAKVPLDAEKHVVGDEIIWEIRTTIPNNNNLTILKITDILSEVLDFNAADASALQMQIGTTWEDTMNNNTWLTPGLDFSVNVAPSAGAGSNDKITATVAPSGLTKVNGKKGQTLITHIKTTVNNKFAGNGEVLNNAGIITNKPGSNIEEEATPPESISKYGKVRVNKVNAQGAALKDAKFDVYYSHLESPNFSNKTDPTVGYVKTPVTCDMTGKTFCEFSVRLSDWAENMTVTAGDSRYNYYFLVETQAPGDYELLAEPWKFVVEQSDVDGDYVKKVAIDVVNVKHGGGIELPFTGGAGTIMFVVIGAALLAGATAMTVIRSRQRKSEV
ncbi:SpaH/EbpB family LPXTG-anchored major pilin [Leucobacter viscericola]|uniref:SpaH/EbpB family LPXTG-anchored major pilin n=1 Tax=Leucobacter viscericola TaxID=2714935 RepID=A0A6G7XDS2_9MICO|nr:SpaH/EbpB family LPXTG-anchored major pilin [Leucobacter viscericola]QIK62652.1 SpaH/EbpB family LPXTG-anchored major pilin [Leucobacter viscericola]